MILDEIVADKRKRLPEHKARISEEKMKELAYASTRKGPSFLEALKKPGLSIIGEFKKASPSMGVIDGSDRPVQCFRGCDQLPDRGGSFSWKCGVF